VCVCVCVWANDWYLNSFRYAAPSVAAPAVDDVASMYDSAKVSVRVTSQVIHFPACHGICVRPFGRLPSERKRPIGSLTADTLARPRVRQTRSFKVWCDETFCLHYEARPWVPSGTTLAPHAWALMRLTKPSFNYSAARDTSAPCRLLQLILLLLLLWMTIFLTRIPVASFQQHVEVAGARYDRVRRGSVGSTLAIRRRRVRVPRHTRVDVLGCSSSVLV